MAQPRQDPPGARQRREEILDAALAIADEKGLAAVTMRAVAGRVGVTAMALYPYVRSKEDLLDGLVGRVLSELELPDPALPWRDRLIALGRSARQVAGRHAAVVALLFARPAITPDALRVVDATYLALMDAGVPHERVARFERMFSTFVLGFAASEASGRFSPGSLGTRERRGQFPESELPAHFKLASWLDAPWSRDAEFEADLDDLIGLIKSAPRPAGPPRSR